MKDSLKNEVVGWFGGPGETGRWHLVSFSKWVVAQYVSFQITTFGTLQINGLRFNEASRKCESNLITIYNNLACFK